MTFHTRAATNEIYDLFNQPLHLSGGLTEEAAEGEGSDEEEEEDAYASGGETTTATGRVSVASENEGMNGEEQEEAEDATGSEWSEFTARKHIPDLDLDLLQASDVGEVVVAEEREDTKLEIVTQGIEKVELKGDTALITPTSPDDSLPSLSQSTFIPVPPEDYEHLARASYRDVAQAGQTRLPFMTPIVERTESSLDPSMANYQREDLPAETPSRGQDAGSAEKEVDVPDCDELMSSPFQELINEAVARHKRVVATKQESILVDLEGEEHQRQEDDALLELSSFEAQQVEDDALLELSKSEEQQSPEGDDLLELSKSEEPAPEEEDLLELSKVEEEEESPEDDDALLELSIPSERPTTPKLVHHTSPLPIINERVCIPTDEHIRQTILEKSQPSLSSFQGFFDHRDTSNNSLHTNKTTEIRKYIKTLKVSQSKQDKHRSSSFARPPSLRFEGSNREYVIKKELGKGAFAPVYLVESGLISQSDDGDEDEEDTQSTTTRYQHGKRSSLEALKMEEPPSAWEFYIMRTAHERLSHHHYSSYPPCIPASIIQAHEFHLFDSECFLLEDYRSQGTLLDLINLAKSDSSAASSSSSSSWSSMSIIAPGSSTGMLNETLIIFFTVELMRTVEALHEKGVIHGDIKADNCLLRLDDPVHSENEVHGEDERGGIEDKGGWSHIYSPSGSRGWSNKGISLIDFGRGIDMHAFRDDVQFKADWIPNAEDCPQIKEGRGWTYQLDYFGLAGVVHSLLWGRYIEVVPVVTAASHSSTSVGRSGGDGTANGADGRHGRDGRDGRDGKEEETRRYKLADKFKRYWQVGLWTEVFELLLNPETYPSSSPPSLSSDAVAADNGLGDGHGDGEEDMKSPRTKAMRRVREMLERWLIEHGSGSGGGGSGVGLKELLKRVEARVGGSNGGNRSK